MPSHSTLIQFMEDCEHAIAHCPQMSWGSDRTIVTKTKMILSGELDGAKLMEQYANNSVLWDAGYSTYLSEFSKQIFQRYFDGLKALRESVWES